MLIINLKLNLQHLMNLAHGEYQDSGKALKKRRVVHLYPIYFIMKKAIERILFIQ